MGGWTLWQVSSMQTFLLGSPGQCAVYFLAGVQVVLPLGRYTRLHAGSVIVSIPSVFYCAFVTTAMWHPE